MKPLLPLALLALAAGCSAPTLDVMPRVGSFDLDGHFGITADPAGAIPVADMGTAGIGKDDAYVGLRADIDVGSPVWYLSAQRTSHGGSGNLATTLSSGADEVGPGPVTSDVDIGLYQAGVTFDMVPIDMVDVGLGLGITTVDLDAVMTDGNDGDSISVDRTLPVPVIALRGGLELGDFEVTALLSGFEISLDGNEVSFFDLDALATYQLFGLDDRLAGSLGLGYRKTNLGVEYEDDDDRVDADFRFDGPYLTFVLSL